MVSFERLSDGKKIHPWQVVLYNTVVYQQKKLQEPEKIKITLNFKL